MHLITVIVAVKVGLKTFKFIDNHVAIDCLHDIDTHQTVDKACLAVALQNTH